MPRSLLLTSLSTLVFGCSLLAACSDDASTPPGQPGSEKALPVGTSSGDPPPTPTGTGTTKPPGPPPEPEYVWVAPKVATTSAACGTAMPDAVKVTYTTPAGRKFHVWGPTGYDPTKTYPVVVVYHGWYSTGDGHQTWFKMEENTQSEAFVVYPDSSGPLWDTNGATDLVFFDDMIKQLGETYCINPSRVLAFGFSFGGIFANHLACKRAGYVKALAVGSGNWGGDGQKCGRLPVLVTSRTDDKDEPPANGRNAASRWTALNKCSAMTDSAVVFTEKDELNVDVDATCITQRGCTAPGSVSFCEDKLHINWNPDYDHTVRPRFQKYVYSWFKALP